MRLSDAVDEIKARVDIVETISRYIDLRRAGRHYKALCPFHSEKTPSFVVNQERQFFHCFGCGVGGDVITFVMKYEDLDFPSAVKKLGETIGIEIEDTGGNKRSSGLKDALLRMHRIATDFFVQQLRESDEGRRYFKRRGLSEETIRSFHLGYAPSGGDVLYHHLRAEGFTEEQILMSGLCKKTDSGRVMDTFRRRVIFPIQNIRGEVIAFGGRTLSEEQLGPKYLNSAESLIFKKSHEIFGLYQAKEEIKKRGYAVLVEGYMDVLVAYQYGIRNAIAPLGTALTEAQVRRMKTLTDKVLVLFDSDEPGVKATKRAMGLLCREGIITKAVTLPQGEDPDSFLRNSGIERLKAIISEAKGIVDFYFSVGTDRDSTIRELVEITSSVKDPIKKGEMVKALSERTGLSEGFIIEALRRQKGGVNNKTRGYRIEREVPVVVPDEEKTLLGIAVSFQNQKDSIMERVGPEMFEDPMVREIFLKIYQEDNLNEVLDGEEMSFVSSVVMSLNIDKNEVEKTVNDCVQKLYRRHFQRRLQSLQRAIKEAEVTNDHKGLQELQIQLMNLLKEGKRDGFL